MNKDNIIIYVSSRNNYDMLKGEVFNIDFEGFEFINVDDGSSKEEVNKGREYCKEKNVIFLQNKSRGVQMATQTVVDFINSNRPNCKYILCFQHDVVPISDNFFSKISSLVSSNKLSDFGAIGFNVLDRGKYTKDSYDRYLNGEKPLGMIGLAHIGIPGAAKRWISPHHNDIATRNSDKWNKPFSIEFPAWMCVGINLKIWNELIKPTDKYHFHLWFPDIAMQLNYHNKPLVVLPHLYCLNQQEVKVKYGINDNSASGARSGNSYHFGEYSNFKVWKERWGWDYENANATFPKVAYKGTLLEEYYEHDLEKGPLNTYNL